MARHSTALVASISPSPFFKSFLRAALSCAPQQ
jgi:hypothetical protein